MFKKKTYREVLAASLDHAKLDLLRAQDAAARAAADVTYSEARLARLQAALKAEDAPVAK